MDDYKLVFMGTSSFALPSLELLMEKGYPVKDIITRPDQPAGRGKKLKPPPLKEKAGSYKLNIWQPRGKKELLELLRSLEPEMVVNVAFGMILPREVLELPPWGCINVHPSLLPLYRGAAPIQRAIMAGEDVTGVTVLYMSPGLDAGDIILQEKTFIGKDEKYGELCYRLANMGAEALVNALELIKRGRIFPRPQEEDRATYAPPIDKGELKIDWNRQASEINDHIRALNPRPGAHTFFGSRRIKILEALPLDDEVEKENYPPGTVYRVDKDFFEVSAGNGVLRILKLQPEGKKIMSVKEFLAGNRLQAGDRFE